MTTTQTGDSPLVATVVVPLVVLGLALAGDATSTNPTAPADCGQRT